MNTLKQVRNQEVLGPSELKKKVGFTLVEVLVAGILLSIFIASALAILVQVTRSAKLVRQRTDATTLAWNRLERARNMQFVEIDDLAEGSPGTRVNEAGLPDANGDFMRQTIINLETNGMEVKRIRIEVLPKSVQSSEFEGQPEIVESIIADIQRVGSGG